MEKELVSMIVPAYNAQRYIERCLDSLVRQTYDKIEILLIDDGSTDHTGRICDAYASKDPRIRVFHVTNGGVSAARNRGIQEALGEFLLFVDSDDYVADDYVESHYRAICQGNADWAITGYYICHPTETETNEIPPDYVGICGPGEFAKRFSNLYQAYFLNSPWNKIYKRALLPGGFPLDMALGEDLYFNLQYLGQVKTIVLSSACCYYYMCDDAKDSLTKRISKENVYSEIRNFQMLQKVCQTWKVEDTTEIARMYVRGITAMLFSLAGKKLPAKEMREILKKLCQDCQTREAMKEARTGSWKSEILQKPLSYGIWQLPLVILLVRKGMPHRKERLEI